MKKEIQLLNKRLHETSQQVSSVASLEADKQQVKLLNQHLQVENKLLEERLHEAEERKADLESLEANRQDEIELLNQQLCEATQQTADLTSLEADLTSLEADRTAEIHLLHTKESRLKKLVRQVAHQKCCLPMLPS